MRRLYSDDHPRVALRHRAVEAGRIAFPVDKFCGADLENLTSVCAEQLDEILAAPSGPVRGRYGGKLVPVATHGYLQLIPCLGASFLTQAQSRQRHL